MIRTTTDPTIAHIASVIDRVGWAVVAVGTGHCDRPDCKGDAAVDPFAYTVGLHAMRLPEVIVRDLDSQTAQRVLNDVAQHQIDGGRVRKGSLVVADGAYWMTDTASPADQADMRIARAFARGSGRRLTLPLRLNGPLVDGVAG